MFDPWVSKSPWRKKGQPTPVFLPGKFHGQRGLAVYSPQGLHIELDTTETEQALTGHSDAGKKILKSEISGLKSGMEIISFYHSDLEVIR